MTTEQLSRFFQEQLQMQNDTSSTVPLRNFTMVLFNAGEMGSKNGVEVVNLMVPAKLAKVHFTFDEQLYVCKFVTINVQNFRASSSRYDKCSSVVVDGQPVPISTRDFVRISGKWQTNYQDTNTEKSHQRQLGGMEGIFRSKSAFSIVAHSPGLRKIALQVSRNLFQYYAADTDITSDYTEALRTSGNIISVAIGSDLPRGVLQHHPIQASSNAVALTFGRRDHVWSKHDHPGLAATFLRPLPGKNKRLELVIWGSDAEALRTSARLMPLLTGTGQPDFVIMDRTMLWKGIEGTLAMGFFDHSWSVSPNSYIAV